MKIIEGNIVDVNSNETFKGRIIYSNMIEQIERDISIQSDRYILPGLIDAHVHIESSMLTPLEYSKIAVKHGTIAAVTDPHEIANVCGIDGVRFMLQNAKKTPMKLYFGAPSCVPATKFETSGGKIEASQIEELFRSNECSHLSEMMNYPGVISNDFEVLAKISLAKKYNKKIDGHAPKLEGRDLRKYAKTGISTDHECSTLHEALEKISLGMKIMLRESSASKDFKNLINLIRTHPNQTMLCADDCHPDELQKGYINSMVKHAIKNGFSIYDILKTASKTAIEHYNLNVGLLQVNDPADFIVVDNLENFDIKQTVINGENVFIDNTVLINAKNECLINKFYTNSICINDLEVTRNSDSINVIQVIEDSLLTNKLVYKFQSDNTVLESNIDDDILKIVVLNRYSQAKPIVGFITGFNLQKGAIASTIAHDSHNIVAVGVSDYDIFKAITEVQKVEGALCVVHSENIQLLPLPVAGLMSDKNCNEVATQYSELSESVKNLGCSLKSPFMTLAFMSLLVIPDLKIGDFGLFDVNKYEIIKLQN